MPLPHTPTNIRETSSEKGNNKEVNDDWKQRAACRGMDIKIFFPDHSEVNVNSRLVWVQGKQVCDSCVVRQECVEYQLPFEEKACRRDGLWGGLTPTERGQYVFNGKRLKP